MREISSKQARESFGDELSRLKFTGERVVILRHGKPIAALVSFADLAALENGSIASVPPTAPEESV